MTGTENQFLLRVDGNKWCATRPAFINLQESPAGFGDTMDQAASALCRAEAELRERSLVDRVAELEKNFAHTHVHSHSGRGDLCAKCGLDLRDRIHFAA